MSKDEDLCCEVEGVKVYRDTVLILNSDADGESESWTRYWISPAFERFHQDYHRTGRIPEGGFVGDLSPVPEDPN